MNTFECVITRYNEHLNWIVSLPDTITKIYIYNKGTNENYFKNYTITPQLKSKITFINIENVGRIDHTIVYHILNNWENLPDNLIFLPGSAVMCSKKGLYLSMLKKNLQKIKTKYHGFYAPRCFKVIDSFDYSINNYEPLGKCNRNKNKFIKSEYPSLKAWKSAIIDDVPLEYIQFRGMFMVSRENILYIKKNIYDNLLKSLSVGDNIENGHYAERIWAHLFKQRPKNYTEPIEPPKTVVPVESGEPAEPVEPPIESVESPDEQVQSTEPVESPILPIEPVQSVESGEYIVPIESGEPAEPVESPIVPIEPVQSVESIEQNEYIVPIEPGEPVEPIEPVEQVQSGEPGESVEPDEPDEPAEPDEPDEPDEPGEPVEPDEPDESVQSVESVEPDEPDESIEVVINID